MKKLLALLLALVMIFALAACGETEDKDDKDDDKKPGSSQTNPPAANSIVGTWTWTFKMTGDMMGYEGLEAGLDMTVKQTYTADGKCTISMDSTKMVASYPAFEEALIDYMIENMFDGNESVRDVLKAEFESQDMCGQLVELYGSMSSNGTYVIDGDTLTVTPSDSDAEDEVYTFKLSGDTLELTPNDDATLDSMGMFGVDKLVLKRA